MNHVGRIRHQYRTLKNLRNNQLSPEWYYIHVDFSENYVCKYNREYKQAILKKIANE